MNPKQVKQAVPQSKVKGATPPSKKKVGISTQSALPFSEIHDGIVVMRDGSLRMIIMASPINYDLKSGDERNAIEYAYQGFLNGLHFPIQIIVRSRKIDLTNYLENLEKLKDNQGNELLASLMEDYIYNIRGLVQDANIMRKEFFVVVPLFNDIEDAITRKSFFSELGKVFGGGSKQTIVSPQKFFENCRDLRQRTQFVAQGLAQIGIRCVRLKTQEIIELFYSCYNLEESMYQALIPTGEIIGPSLVTRKEKLAPARYTKTVINERSSSSITPNINPQNIAPNIYSAQALPVQQINNQPMSIADKINAEKAAKQPQARGGLSNNYTNIQPGAIVAENIQNQNLSQGLYNQVS